MHHATQVHLTCYRQVMEGTAGRPRQLKGHASEACRRHRFYALRCAACVVVVIGGPPIFFFFFFC